MYMYDISYITVIKTKILLINKKLDYCGMLFS